jgi:hypothetical protein
MNKKCMGWATELETMVRNMPMADLDLVRSWGHCSESTVCKFESIKWAKDERNKKDITMKRHSERPTRCNN